MHDLLGDMGREIVRQESVKDPGRRSRLWYHEDSHGVLEMARICNLSRVENLNLSRCDVSHLPGEIGRLISLLKLDLGGNNLLTLPDSFCNLAIVSDLDLKDCNLSHCQTELEC
ncbi:hypothetical protein RHGRI_035622 [Rhododendron griersonianum]|uniref:Uncharacterized protein n=1 Tax=Rhododendron griersonianum TaxID=479676 RepID=A0AAV6HK91_9ERIC|nr:hypothetical protein RHGRI_035622 [Rhododendron griersonianum]